LFNLKNCQRLVIGQYRTGTGKSFLMVTVISTTVAGCRWREAVFLVKLVQISNEFTPVPVPLPIILKYETD